MERRIIGRTALVLVGGVFWIAAARAQVVNVLQSNQRIQQQIQQQNDLSIEGPPVIAPATPPTVVGPPGGATFLLKRVVFDHSDLLPQAELDAIVAPLLGTRIDSSQIQRIVAAVNDLYAEKKSLTAIAYLPKQDLADGVLHIGMVEGRLGALRVKNAKFLPADMVTNGIAAPVGAVVDVPAIADNVAWFNRTHSAQVQAALQPGASFGLTDIELSVAEPPTNLMQFFVDNQGVTTIGALEGGFNYQHYGLLGVDDKFTAYGAFSSGDVYPSLGYNLPFNPWGGRVGVSASRGLIWIVQGPYAHLHVKGNSVYAAVNLSQPVVITQNWALLVNASFADYLSKDTYSSIPEINNTTLKETFGVTFGYTSEKISANVSPNFSTAQTKYALTQVRQDFQATTGTYSATAQLPYDFVASLGGAWQVASQSLLAGDQLFQIGGPTTVRGYPTDAFAGYAGYYGNLDLHHNLNTLLDGLDVYAFFDHGTGYSTFPRQLGLNSVGTGLIYDTHHYLTAELSVGVPITKAVANQSACAIYFRVTSRFEGP